MSNPIAELSRLRAETDARLLLDAKRQFSWFDILTIFPASALILWMAPGRAGTEAIVLTSLVMVIWRVSARLDAAVELLRRQLPRQEGQ